VGGAGQNGLAVMSWPVPPFSIQNTFEFASAACSIARKFMSAIIIADFFGLTPNAASKSSALRRSRGVIAPITPSYPSQCPGAALSVLI
jgi:hypothetical protein